MRMLTRLVTLLMPLVDDAWLTTAAFAATIDLCSSALCTTVCCWLSISALIDNIFAT
jgi:hypothetical protein